MSKAKKNTPKPSKPMPAKATPQAKSSTGRAAAKKTPAKLLSAEEKQRLLKPQDGFAELAERFVTEWKGRPTLKVAGLSPAKLQRAIESAKKTLAKENALRSKLEEKLRPLSDARLQAEHEAYKMVLDAYAVAKALARVDPAMGHAFAFVGEAMTPRSKRHIAPLVEPLPEAEKK